MDSAKIFGFDEKLLSLAEKAEENITGKFKEIENITRFNQTKVLKAFTDNKTAETDLWGTTGYGYSDAGREKADKIFAQVFGAEDALIRYDFACGTHTLTVALFGILRPGDTVISVAGRPYDTICPVIGMDGREGKGSLSDFGVNYGQIDFTPDDEIDFKAIENRFKNGSFVKMAYIQRSRGYSLRHSLSAAEIGKICDVVHSVSPDTVVFVDNCYGEFAEKTEPTEVGADLIAGSLIKNPGGAIAKKGGYIAGRKDLVKLCSYRMTAPSLGSEVGASVGANRDIIMGLFNSPHVVGEALKTAVFTSELFRLLGYKTLPMPDDERHDIVQAVLLENRENLISFCRGLQAGSPVDSYLTPEPWDMPGYDSQVIMAAGTFTSGSSIEISGDAPLREPFAVWMQGGINFDSARVAVLSAANEVVKRKIN